MTTNDFEFVKSHEEPDFAIRRVGVNAGRIFGTMVKEKSSQSHHFIRVREKKETVLKNLHSLNLEEAEVKFQTVAQPSVAKSELCEETLL